MVLEVSVHGWQILSLWARTESEHHGLEDIGNRDFHFVVVKITTLQKAGTRYIFF
jgi:hypothetical protein